MNHIFTAEEIYTHYVISKEKLKEARDNKIKVLLEYITVLCHDAASNGREKTQIDIRQVCTSCQIQFSEDLCILLRDFLKDLKYEVKLNGFLLDINWYVVKSSEIIPKNTPQL